MRTEASGGIVLLVAAVAAVAWANSPWADGYFRVFDTVIEINFGDFHFAHLSDLTVRDWINDGLMAVFFFVVGLEIKRELAVGDLRDPKAAALPAIAALGGMVVPAGLYLAFNAGGAAAHGWGIPMATDIAFAVGVISLVGNRVPIAAKLFLLALAIVDDLGAILVIAIFYTDGLSFAWLIAAGVGLALMGVMQKLQIRQFTAFVVVGLFVWLAVLESGVHATVAGVALGLLTPSRPFYSPRWFGPRSRRMLESVEGYLDSDEAPDHHTLERVHSAMSDLRRLAAESVSPLDRLEHALQPYSSFFVVPLFALANAGVAISSEMLGGVASDPIVLGVFVGLVVGKTLGVAGAAWLAVKAGIGRMPARTTWRHIIGLSMLAGIGFTVALFIAALSFSDPAAGDSAKVGIFAASLLAGIAGFVWLRLGPEPESKSRSS